MMVFSKSLKIDIASTSYILIIPFVLAIIQYFHSKTVKVIAKYYHLVVLIFDSIIIVIAIQLFKFWSSKINLKSFVFVKKPNQS
ncbi:MAG: hypothetical protein ACI8ZX_001319, partial [Planctomycetota bacterium]